MFSIHFTLLVTYFCIFVYKNILFFISASDFVQSWRNKLLTSIFLFLTYKKSNSFCRKTYLSHKSSFLFSSAFQFIAIYPKRLPGTVEVPGSRMT